MSQRRKPTSKMNNTIGREAPLGPPWVISCGWPNNWNCSTTSKMATRMTVRMTLGKVMANRVRSHELLSSAAAS